MQSWIHIEGLGEDNQGSGNGSFSIRVDEYFGRRDRSDVVKVSAKTADIEKSVTVKQAGHPAFIEWKLISNNGTFAVDQKGTPVVDGQQTYYTIRGRSNCEGLVLKMTNGQMAGNQFVYSEDGGQMVFFDDENHPVYTMVDGRPNFEHNGVMPQSVEMPSKFMVGSTQYSFNTNYEDHGDPLGMDDAYEFSFNLKFPEENEGEYEQVMGIMLQSKANSNIAIRATIRQAKGTAKLELYNSDGPNKVVISALPDFAYAGGTQVVFVESNTSWSVQ